MRDLYLNCNGANQATAGGGVYARGAVWCVFDHVWFETPWEAGIRFYQDGTGYYGHHNSHPELPVQGWQEQQRRARVGYQVRAVR